MQRASQVPKHQRVSSHYVSETSSLIPRIISSFQERYSTYYVIHFIREYSIYDNLASSCTAFVIILSFQRIMV